MKLLYQAQNTLEAHMILNILEQCGLSARIDGEYLQGAIGEVPPVGIVRVMVEEADFPAARKVIEEWEAQQATLEASFVPARKSGIGGGIIGFLCGAAAMVFYYYNTAAYDGIDYDGDGSLDERWTYINDLIAKTEQDRNLDGQVDLIYLYDHEGEIASRSDNQE